MHHGSQRASHYDPAGLCSSHPAGGLAINTAGRLDVKLRVQMSIYLFIFSVPNGFGH